MKRITVILLCILLCVSIVGCTANTDSPIDSTPTASTVSTTETGNDGEQQIVPDTETESSKTTGATTESTPETTEASNTDTDVPPTTTGTTPTTEPDKPDTSLKPDTSTEVKKDETPAPTESNTQQEETKPQETEPEETKPQETTPPKEETKPTEESKPTKPEPTEPTEPEEPTDPYAYPFNINQIRQDCIAQGKSYGFTLDESLTPNNSSWAGAETASASTQGTRLKRFLSEMIEYYSPAYREVMGLPEANITAFNIYFEDLGNNTYRIYFLFLL